MIMDLDFIVLRISNLQRNEAVQKNRTFELRNDIANEAKQYLLENLVNRLF